jgi:uncharacterized membrane protein YhhN
MKTKLLTAIYIVIGIVYIIFNSHLSFFPGLALKALIVPVLIIIYLLNAHHKLNIFILAALIFSWAGDIILDFSFIPGLLCFLLAHVMYATAFFKTSGESLLSRKPILLILPLVLYGAGLIFLLYDHLDGMRLPVIIYALVIMTMLAGAINRYSKVNRVSYLLVFAGALLFVISDSLIAVNKFGFPFRFSGTAIMITYIAAQYLIVTGVLRQSGEELL